MCLLRAKKNVPKGECNQEYGILMHNMEEDCLFGTFLMQDRRYVTLSWQHLDKAFRKVLEYDYVISPTMEKQLQDLYNAAMADVFALEHQIEISQCAYKQMQADATLAREAKRAARNSTSKANVPTTAPTMKRVTKGRPKITIFGTQEDCGELDMVATHPILEKEIASDNANFPPPLAMQEEVGKVQAPRQQSRQSGRKILSLTKRRSLINVANNEFESEEHIAAKGANYNELEEAEQRKSNKAVLFMTSVAKQRSDVNEDKGIDAGEQKSGRRYRVARSRGIQDMDKPSRAQCNSR